MFYSVNCEHCDAMLPIINELLQEQGIEIDVVEVKADDSESVAFYDQYEKGNCGGVPFFVNTMTGAWLCGEVTKAELQAWAEQTS